MKLQELYEYKNYSHSGQGYDYAEYRGRPRLHDVNPNLGPHEGKELAMLLDGVKPAALVSEAIYKKHFKKHVDDGTLIAKEFTDRDSFVEMIVALPGEEQRVERLIKLLTMSEEDVDKLGIERYSAQLGRLFGYTKEQVRAFLDHTRARRGN
jgi:hypothetical protein